MSKTIKVPAWRNPYEVEINGVKYKYPAGEEIDVPDAVAEVIERDIAAHSPNMAPAGENAKVFRVRVYYEECDKTYEEVKAAIDAGMIIACDYQGEANSKGTAYGWHGDNDAIVVGGAVLRPKEAQDSDA